MTLKWREQLELWDSMRIACWVREDGFSVHRLTSFGGLVRYRVYAPEGVPVADWPVFDTLADAMREADRKIVSWAHVKTEGNA